MLYTTDAGQVRHRSAGIHHAIPKPRRSEAESALVLFSEYLESLARTDLRAARKLRKARDVLAVVVNTAY